MDDWKFFSLPNLEEAKKRIDDARLTLAEEEKFASSYEWRYCYSKRLKAMSTELSKIIRRITEW